MQLRQMTMEDADFLLEMKNYPETRMFSILTPHEIKKEDHYKWLEDNIQFFQVILSKIESPYVNDVSIKHGIVRIKDNEISIWIHRSSWGKGIASYVLEMVSEKGMIARIVEGNIASMRAFGNAGFKPIEYKDNYYIFQK